MEDDKGSGEIMTKSKSQTNTESNNVTDSVTQTNMQVVGLSPAIALTNQMMMQSQAAGTSMFNQVGQFNNSNIQSLANIAKSTQMMLGKNPRSRLRKVIDEAQILAGNE